MLPWTGQCCKEIFDLLITSFKGLLVFLSALCESAFIIQVSFLMVLDLRSMSFGDAPFFSKMQGVRFLILQVSRYQGG